MFFEASPRRRGTEHFSYNFYTYTDPIHSELMKELNRNRVAKPVLEPYTTWSTGTRLSVPVLNILKTKNDFKYRYSPTISA